MKTTIVRIVGVVGLSATSWPLALATIPPAAAAPCPDVEVVFARGTTEPPGVGGIGQVFVDSLRSQLGERSVGVYPVNYPASREFDTSTPAGRDDLSAHVQSMAASCPNTKMVLGGYSQGAAVVDLATGAMPPAVADHVAATALFGGPKSSFADSLSVGPSPPALAPLCRQDHRPVCPNDPICSEGGRDWGAHGAYVRTGLVNRRPPSQRGDCRWPDSGPSGRTKAGLTLQGGAPRGAQQCLRPGAASGSRRVTPDDDPMTASTVDPATPPKQERRTGIASGSAGFRSPSSSAGFVSSPS